MQAIQVENLFKSYLVGHNNARIESYTALRDVLSRNARNLASKTRDRLTGRQIVQGDEVEEFWALKDITTNAAPTTASASMATSPASSKSAFLIPLLVIFRAFHGE